MSSLGSIQEWPLESVPKSLENAFLWEQPFDSLASLCNNGVKELMVSCFLPVIEFPQSSFGTEDFQNQRKLRDIVGEVYSLKNTKIP
jgi:hypothetical protein